MCLLGATHNIWCNMASAASGSASVVGATVVGAVVIGAAEVGVPSGVLYVAVLV